MNSYSITGASPSLIGTRIYIDEDFEIDEKTGDYTRSYYYIGYIGGTPYDAPAVAYIENSSVHLHQIYRDNIGSIVMYAGDFGTSRMAYTPWGARLMSTNPMWVFYYTPSAAPSSFKFIRGFGSHEIIPFFGLLNANARIYNPYIGRFLSPDPILATSGDPLDMNPYIYARNNPLSYVDQDGEFPWMFLAAALFGGVTNVATNWKNIHNFGDGLLYFGVGACSAAVSSIMPFGGGFLGGFLNGTFFSTASGILLRGGNASISGEDPWKYTISILAPCKKLVPLVSACPSWRCSRPNFSSLGKNR